MKIVAALPWHLRSRSAPRTARSLLRLLPWLAAWPFTASAQTAPITPDPLSSDPILRDHAPADDTMWQRRGDVSFSYDDVSGLPGERDVGRGRARLRLGWQGSTGDLDFGIAARLGAGTDDNADNRRNNDNQASNGIALDQAWLRWSPSTQTSLQFGQGPLPLRLTPLTWDRDLRPIGLFVDQRWPVGELDDLRLVAGHFAGNHLYDDDSRIDAAQLGWRWHTGAPFSFDLQIAWIAFDRLQRATEQGLARSNRHVLGRLLSDYELLDLHVGLQWQLASGPLDLRLDLLENRGADDDNRGARLSLVHGNADRDTGLELGLSWQRIGRDAAMAAFNSDDWWFHSAARGVMPWLAYGWADGALHGWAVQASLFHERADGRSTWVDRVLIEFRRPF